MHPFWLVLSKVCWIIENLFIYFSVAKLGFFFFSQNTGYIGFVFKNRGIYDSFLTNLVSSQKIEKEKRKYVGSKERGGKHTLYY